MDNIVLKRAKSHLIKTPAYYFLLRLRSFYEYNLVCNKNIEKTIKTTAYCISPYKTGTTFITNLFKNSCCSMHEPLQFTTLLHINDNIFLRKRYKFINADIEASGFFADRLDQVRMFAPESPVLYIIRSPEKWINSVVNYFAQLSDNLSYNYIARMIFDPICRERIDDFYNLPEKNKSNIVKGLLEYWIKVYTNAKTDTKTLVINLETINDNISKIEDFFGYKAIDVNKADRYETKKKKSFNIHNYIDFNNYKDKVSALGY